jgi:1-acyl-sn-glycerol-3-phosphate acyltransferase
MTRGLFAGAVYRLMIWLYRRYGWRATGDIPAARKYVLLAVPHTSNWDFPYTLGLFNALGVTPHFMAKSSLFRWPLTNFMRDVGGVPVDRAAASDMVAQMVAEFAARDEFVLTIAPEGTRGSVAQWRSGFYRIAIAAGVPIVCGFLDYGTKTGGIGPTIIPTGNYDADMAPAFEFYRGMVGKNVKGMSAPSRRGGVT